MTFAPASTFLVVTDNVRCGSAWIVPSTGESDTDKGVFAVIDVLEQRTIIGPIRAHEGLAGDPIVANDRHELIVVHRDATVMTWDLSPAPIVGRYAYSPSGKGLASIHDSMVLRWDAAAIQPIGPPLAASTAK